MHSKENRTPETLSTINSPMDNEVTTISFRMKGIRIQTSSRNVGTRMYAKIDARSIHCLNGKVATGSSLMDQIMPAAFDYPGLKPPPSPIKFRTHQVMDHLSRHHSTKPSICSLKHRLIPLSSLPFALSHFRTNRMKILRLLDWHTRHRSACFPIKVSQHCARSLKSTNSII